MDALVVLVLKVAAAGAGIVLFVYLLYRAVLGAKKMRGTGSGEIVTVLLLGLGTGIAPAPPREVKMESRHLGDKDDSGDRPDSASPEPAELPGRTAE